MNNRPVPSFKFVGVSVSPVVIRVVLESGHLDWRACRGVGGSIYGHLDGVLDTPRPAWVRVKCDIDVGPDGITADFVMGDRADELEGEVLKGIAAVLADPAFAAALNSSHDRYQSAESASFQDKIRREVEFAPEYVVGTHSRTMHFNRTGFEQDPRYPAARARLQKIAANRGLGDRFDAWWASENWLPYTD